LHPVLSTRPFRTTTAPTRARLNLDSWAIFVAIRIIHPPKDFP